MKGSPPLHLLLFAIAFAVLAMPLSQLTSRSQAQPAAGQPRDVDVDEVKDQVRKGALSGHPADFAKPAP